MPIAMLIIIKMTNIKNWTFLKVFLLALDIPVILLDASSTFVCHFENYVINAHIYIYAFSRRFYPKRRTVHSGYTCFVNMCIPWESNPQPLRC